MVPFLPPWSGLEPRARKTEVPKQHRAWELCLGSPLLSCLRQAYWAHKGGLATRIKACRGAQH